jgi:hypothetical protein
MMELVDFDSFSNEMIFLSPEGTEIAIDWDCETKFKIGNKYLIDTDFVEVLY